MNAGLLFVILVLGLFWEGCHAKCSIKSKSVEELVNLSVKLATSEPDGSKFDEAIECLKKAHKISPHEPQPLFYIARIVSSHFYLSFDLIPEKKRTAENEEGL